MSTYAKKIQLIRNHYNHKIKTHPHNTAIHTEYALFEELLNEYNRSRTIYENAVAHNHSNTNLWKNYACFELRQCDINRCRSILERAVQMNPREISLWLFFAELEEDMMNIAGVIDVYGRMVAENNTEDCYWHAYNFYLMVDDGLANEVLKTMDEKFAGVRIKVEKLVRMNDFSVVPALCDRWESMDDKTYVKIVDKLEKAGRLQDAFIFVKRGKYRFGSKFFKDQYKKMSTGVVDEDDDAHCSALLCEAARLEEQKEICAAEQMYKGLLNVINRKYRTKSFILYSKFLIRREKLQLARKTTDERSPST
ncbi:Cell cycle control protein (crooked neck) [Trachipleistophora hominis]|uniref:Cell cycle control protein (Crooked neck) n=1 Tax=Trachipleistophora hominis TaxID=72359 RepID=L7JVX1_TRAHO|nr:Cell cycle control protein (crooked neck) [Trachipleistophora hominis]